jgi:S1-C subfamily serine protease
MSRRIPVAFAFVSASLLVALLAPAATAQTTTTVGTPEERAAAIARPAMFYTEQYFKAWVRVPASSQLGFQGYVNNGSPFEWATRCSAFAVNPDGYLVTAGHCVDLGEEGARATALELATQWLVDDGWIFQDDFDFWLNEGHLIWGVEGTERGSDPDFEMWVQRGVAAGGLRTGEALPARVVNYQPWSQGDIAIVKIEQSDIPTVLLAPEADVTIGTDVLSIGYPGSSDAVTDQTLEPTFKDGQINSEKTREGGLLPVYEMSAALSGGMSGGPTANLNGDIVGVNSFNITGETEAFNFISPVSLVTEMLAQNGVENVLGPVDEAYRAGIDAYFSGDYQGAIERFDQVLSLSPTHQLAQEYRVKASQGAAENPSPSPTAVEQGGGAVAQPATTDESGFPAWAIALIGVGAVVLLGLVFLLARRRPAPVAPAATAAGVGAGVAPPVPSPPSAPTLRAVEPVSEAPRFCSSCGHQIEPGARFCPACGHKIEVA